MSTGLEESRPQPSAQAGVASPSVLRIVVDDRERASAVPGVLAGRSDVRIEWRRLDLGDYRVEDRVVVERKNTRDFVLSLVDGRLFSQVSRLRGGADHALLIIQGGDVLATGLRVEPAAIRGALASIVLAWNLPVLFARNAEETAEILCAVARQVIRTDRGLWLRGGRKPRRPDRRKSYLLQGLPGVGPVLAKALLQRFGSVERIVRATVTELQDLRGIGPAKARCIHDTLR